MREEITLLPFEGFFDVVEKLAGNWSDCFLHPTSSQGARTVDEFRLHTLSQHRFPPLLSQGHRLNGSPTAPVKRSPLSPPPP